MGDLLCSVSAGLPNPEEDDRNNDLGSADKCLKEKVNKLILDSIGKEIEKAYQSIYPLHDVSVRKVKMLKKPKFELRKLMEFHGEGSRSGKATGNETGAKVEQADGYEPPVQESI
ncbi:40S ribosomal protein S3a [Tupaia chinensis]|uniref:40S ribosomal protein S3a n=1 Tax=Tupaia chinensis TaxID=246437 RepID=L9KRJ4_TUPCH|nr:40S ribosomal protein S3a [Tupaia chinensis]